MTHKNKDVYKALLRKWFIISGGRNKDHKYLVYVIDDHILARTYISHGSNEDLSPELFGDMAKQCHLSRAEFEKFIECTYSAEDYRAYQEARLSEILREKASGNPKRGRK
jgi:hypothetical protein